MTSLRGGRRCVVFQPSLPERCPRSIAPARRALSPGISRRPLWLTLNASQASEGPLEGSSDTGLLSQEQLEADAPPSDTTLERQMSGEQASTSGKLHSMTQPIATACKGAWRTATEKLATLAAFLTAMVAWIPAVKQRIHLKRLRLQLEQQPKDSERHAALARALNSYKKPEQVLELWDGEKFAVSDACAAEYLKALVLSGRMSNYVGTDMLRVVQAAFDASRSGEQTTSVADLLQHCQQRLASGKGEGQQPGGNSLRPLHVVLQGPGYGQPQRTGNFLLGFLKSVLSFVTTTCLVSMLVVVGFETMRKYSPAVVGGSAAPGAPPMSTASPAFAPKEYNKEVLPEKSVKTFQDVRGCDEAKAEVAEVVEFLKHPDRFTRLGGKLPKGILLTGPPGTGKTLLARAIAGEAGVPFFFRSGSEFEEMFVGVGSRRVRNLFAAAKKASPCIVFIDEIDAVGQARGTSLESGSSKTLNQLLVEMDGFEPNDGVVVIAATNLEKKLDAALTRPGRFDRCVAVPLPDVRGRLDIIDYYLKGKPLAEDVQPQLLARRTPGFSGAMLSNLINEAALSAAKQNKDAIAARILDEARDKILMGSPRASMVQTAEARRLTAYHESGHALVALNTRGATPVHKATIVPRGHALGMVSMVPHQDEYSTTKQQMLASIDVCMGGKAAEELIFGEDQVTSGATSDLMSATQQARHMVMECGMSSQIGPMYVPTEKSAEVRKTIDSEVGQLLKEAYARVTRMLAEKQADLHKLAKALLEHETLTAEEIQQVLDGTFDKAPVAKSAAASEVEALLGPVAARSGPLHSAAGSQEPSAV